MEPTNSRNDLHRSSENSRRNNRESGRKSNPRNSNFSDHAPKHLKLLFGINFFFLFISVFCMITFLNPSFIKGQIAKEANQTLITTAANDEVVGFVKDMGEDEPDDKDILTTTQATPIAMVIADYTLGIHGYNEDHDALGADIQKILTNKIDDNSSDAAKAVKEVIAQKPNTAKYAIISGFKLNDVTMAANVVTTLFIIFGSLAVFTLFSIVYLFTRYKKTERRRQLFNQFFGGLTWASGIMIAAFLVLAVVPMFLDVTTIMPIIPAIIVNISSDVFLELIIPCAAFFAIGMFGGTATAKN